MATADDPTGWMQAWRTAAAALAMGTPVPGAAGFQQAGAAFERFARDFARGAGKAPPSGDPVAAAEARAVWEASARELLGAARGPQMPPDAPPGLAGALARWAAVQSALAADLAARFVERLRTPPAPTSLRAAFDAFIDCAEAAFQAAARTDAFVTAQGELLNELVLLRAHQQRLVDTTARLAGLPNRAEVDALHDALAALRAQVDTLQAASPAQAARPRPAGRRQPRTPRRKRR